VILETVLAVPLVTFEIVLDKSSSALSALHPAKAQVTIKTATNVSADLTIFVFIIYPPYCFLYKQYFLIDNKNPN